MIMAKKPAVSSRTAEEDERCSRSQTVPSDSPCENVSVPQVVPNSTRRVTRSLSKPKTLLESQPEPRSAEAAPEQVPCSSLETTLAADTPASDSDRLSRHYPPAPPFPFYTGPDEHRRLLSTPSSIFHRRDKPLSAPSVTTPPGRQALTMSPFRGGNAPVARGPYVPLSVSWQVKLAVVTAALFGFLLAVIYTRLSPSPLMHPALPEGQWVSASGFGCADAGRLLLPHETTGKDALDTPLAVGSSRAGAAVFLQPEPQIPFDYALLSLGARVLSTRDTQPLTLFDAKLLGFTIFQESDWNMQAEAPLLPLVIPGRCWRFQGFPGRLVIQLAEAINISGFSLSHVSSRTAPVSRLHSAPARFEVWALATEEEAETGALLGNYTYRLASAPATQFFAAQHAVPWPVGIVELRVLSNHGAPRFTCVYRFKVFGVPAAESVEEPAD